MTEERSGMQEQMEYVEDLEESDEEDIEDIAARLGHLDGDSAQPSDDDSGSESADGSENDTDGSGSEDVDGEDSVDVAKRKRGADMGAGPSSRQGRAVKRRPNRDSGGARKRGRGVELEVEQEHEVQHALNR